MGITSKWNYTEIGHPKTEQLRNGTTWKQNNSETEQLRNETALKWNYFNTELLQHRTTQKQNNSETDQLRGETTLTQNYFNNLYHIRTTSSYPKQPKTIKKESTL